MISKPIDKTDRYTFERLSHSKNDKSEFSISSGLMTCYIHSGTATLNVLGTPELETIALNAGEGFVLTPGTRYRIDTDAEFTAYRVSSVVKPGEIIEIVEDGAIRQEIPIKNYKIIRNPKKVIKPWGHELWILWTRDYHVLKQIGMTAGSKCSLQFHRQKLETNCLQEGQADVIMGYQLDPQESVEAIQKSLKDFDFKKYTKRITPGFHWTSHPGVVHRVIAVTDYIAYEVSTSELDDVIRLKDETGRQSGRIESEHK
jgi:mannose-6-phosphate isomerase